VAALGTMQGLPKLKSIIQAIITSLHQRIDESNKLAICRKKTRELLSKMVSAHNYPFQMVEHKYFKLFVASLQPNYKLKTLLTIKEDCMNLFQSMKVDLLKEISQAKRLALTTDLWSSHDANGYMVITVHFINASWKLINHVISFKELPTPHTGVAIADQLLKSLVEWKSITKCSFITLDNASSNNVAAL
jgi:hypothetical protein